MRGWLLGSYVALWTLVLFVFVLNLAILRQLGLIFIRLGGSLGARQTPAGPELGVELPGNLLSESRLSLLKSSRRLQLLLIMSSTCSVCDAILPDLPLFARSVSSDAEVKVILLSPDDQAKFASLKVDVSVYVDTKFASEFDVPVFPYGLVLGDNLRVLSKGLVNDLLQVESLLNQAQEDASLPQSEMVTGITSLETIPTPPLINEAIPLPADPARRSHV
jgi:methylamine dehydrogenase accessory protein MauD